MNKFIIFSTAFLISWIILGIISRILEKTELLFWIKMKISIRQLMKAESNMYYYICCKSDYLTEHKKEMSQEEINKMKEEIKDSAKTLLDTVKERTNKNNVAYQYFSEKDRNTLKSMAEDVENILKLLE